MISVATSIVQTLRDHGYSAYFAGGWVRDFLLKIPSHEIDIATSAPPEKVTSLFPKTILVGIRFGVVIVVEQGLSFEVTTFRKDRNYHDGRHPEGVDFSTAKNDALRRDFTINGMFYDPLTNTVYDYVGGQEDLKNKILQAIGDPLERFKEDKLRMLRAIRFAFRFNFHIEEKTRAAIQSEAPSLFPAVSIERVVQEMTKMARFSTFNEALLEMYKLNVLQTIFSAYSLPPFEALAKKVAPFPYFPQNTPLIIYLLEFLPLPNVEAIDTLCTYLKLSKKEAQLAHFFFASDTLFLENKAVAWAYFFAHSEAELFLKIKEAKCPPKERAAFLQKVTQKQQALAAHSERIKNKKPLVTSQHLQRLGIEPGKKMGNYLQRAEELAIEKDLNSAEEVLHLLKEELG